MARYTSPTKAQVRETLRRIPTLQLRRAFFEGLRNPLWVEPLAKEGAFKYPPEPEITDDGFLRDVYWPEIGYLIRAAQDAPTAVVDVLLKLSKTNNPWVRRGVFSIGSTIQADQAARLQPLIRAWTSTGFGWRTDPQELVSFAINLLKNGQRDAGKWFVNLLFKPVKKSTGPKPSLRLEDFWYEHELPRVAEALGDDGLSVILPWLVAYERLEGRLKRDSDITYVARPIIRSRSDSYESVEHALVEAVRELAIKTMLLDPAGVNSLLLGAKMILARKIALFSLSQAIGQGAEDDERVTMMLGVANELLFDVASLTKPCRIEYAELARAVALQSAELLAPLTGFLEVNLRDDSDDLRQWLANDGADDSEIDGRVDDYNDQQLHQWLSAIGAEALPDQLRAKLAELDLRLGIIESPLQPESNIHMWTGPNSPITHDEMSVMSPTELTAHLESWHDQGNGWGPEPSHEGQGRQVTTLLTANPTALVGVDDLIGRLRPRYLRAILEGWAAAVKAELEPDWDQVAAVIQSVLTHSDESPFPAEGSQFDDDSTFRLAKQAAVRLLAELAGLSSALVIPAAIMSQFADMLITLADDEAAWSEYISKEGSGMDPLTISLNWQWPIRVRGLIYLMYDRKETGWYEAARSALERELARSDTRGASRAVLGEGLARLYNTDPEWLDPKMPLWFGDDNIITKDQQIALTTAMAIHRYHPKLYELLTPSMVAAIGVGESLAAGWSGPANPLQQIGGWVIDAYIFGYKDLKDPAAHAFFTIAPAKIRGEALGHVAWSFMHAAAVDDAIRDRLADMWDARVEHVRSYPDDKEELNGFHWFVKSQKFDPAWWLPRLKEAAKLNPQLAKSRYMIGSELASSAVVNPRDAFDALKLLLGDHRSDMAEFDLTQNAVPMVLAQAMISGNGELKHEAEAFMNELGAQGHLGLESEVNKMLDEMTANEADE